jgi:hypothetical protein
VLCNDDQPPLVMGNWIGLAWIALSTFLKVSYSHVFQDEGPRMIWDFNLSNILEKLDVDEKECAMGF